jgi:phage shock protein E
VNESRNNFSRTPHRSKGNFLSLIALLILIGLPGGAVLLRAADVTKPPAGSPAEQKAYKDVNAAQFDKLRANKKSVVLDVRTPAEFAAGHIPGAINIDWNSDEFQKKVSELDKSKTCLVNCASGGRSAKACDKLSKLNFTDCYNLLGGFHAWEKAGKPVEK